MYFHLMLLKHFLVLIMPSVGFPMIKNLPANAGDARDNGFNRSGRSPGEGNGNPLLYSCLENPVDRGAWGALAHGVAKSQAWLSMHEFVFYTVYVFIKHILIYIFYTYVHIFMHMHMCVYLYICIYIHILMFYMFLFIIYVFIL